MNPVRTFAAPLVSLFVVLGACVGDTPAGGGPGGGSSGSSTDGDASVTPGSCTESQKRCDTRCVSRDDPSVGCGAEACNPCSPPANSTATCNVGACASTCNPGFLDCDSNPTTGCEVKTDTDVANCGECGHGCGAANTTLAPKCEGGTCRFTCGAGFGHCGTVDEAGCETNLNEDAANCGECGHSCLGGACVAGACQPFRLASAVAPVGLAVDDTTVYFTSTSQAKIWRVRRDGTCDPAAPCPQQFVGDPDPLSQYRGPASIVSNGAAVWFMGEAIGQIGRRDVAGGTITNWGPARSSGPGNLTLAGNKLCWTTNFANTAVAPHLLCSNLDGSGITEMARYPSSAIDFDGPGGVAADDQYVYWASINAGIFRKLINDTTTCVEDTSCGAEIGGPGATLLALDATFLYWIEPTGSVYRALKNGDQQATLATGQAGITSIAVVDSFVYWGVPGAIRRAPNAGAPCAGSSCEQVATVTEPRAIVAASDGLYFTDGATDGGVYRLAK